MMMDDKLKFACENMSTLLTRNLAIMQCYTKAQYMTAIQGFCARHRDVVESFNTYCVEHVDLTSEAAKAVAEQFMADVKAMVEERAAGKKKFAANMEMQTYRQVLAAFVIPAIDAMKFEYSQLLVDTLRNAWNETYPNFTFLQTDVETLNKGLVKLQTAGCYITTAVCDSFGKEDACYELMAFRAFRDGYLKTRPDGASMVQTYYETAPAIVAEINKRANAKDIYRGIWDEYLSKCLTLIETEQYDTCTDLYRNMVETLKKIYL